MATCANCGVETELHELDVPICPACIGNPERAYPSASSALDKLTADLTVAREIYRETIEELEHRRGGSADSPEPHLEKKIQTARQKYRELLDALGEALQRETDHWSPHD